MRLRNGENDQDYGNLQWVSEIWSVRSLYDGLDFEIWVKGMADDALTTLPVEQAHCVEARSLNASLIADLWFEKLDAQSKWKAKVDLFLTCLDDARA